MSEEIPRIKKTAEVGEQPFQLVETQEEILQGWNARLRKVMYLFIVEGKDGEEGKWSYFDSTSGQVVEVREWNGHAARIGGDWVKMTKYARIVVQFLNPVTYSKWDKDEKKEILVTTDRALLTITKTANEQFVKAREGREPSAWYRFIYRVQNKKKGTVFVCNVEHVDPANIPNAPKTAPAPLSEAERPQKHETTIVEPIQPSGPPADFATGPKPQAEVQSNETPAGEPKRPMPPF